MMTTFRPAPPKITGPAIYRLGGLTLGELHDYTGLPACFIEELLFNNLKPDTSWAKDLLKVQTHKQRLVVLEDFETIAPPDAHASVCYHTSIQFYGFPNGQFTNIDMVHRTPRTWPKTSFVEHGWELWEVTGGQVFWDSILAEPARWRWAHSCYRNTELARHFRDACKEESQFWAKDCPPCRQMKALKDYGHGNYGACERCGEVFSIVADHAKGPVIPRHAVPGDSPSLICAGGEWWPSKILEPKEARESVMARKAGLAK